MNESSGLDHVKLLLERILFVFLFIDSDLKEPKYYLNAILDRPHSRLNGYPLRFATDNDLVYNIIKDNTIDHSTIEDAFNSDSSSILHSKVSSSLKNVVDYIFGFIGFTKPNMEKVIQNIEIQTFSVESVNLACYILFSPVQIRTNSIVVCPKCKTEYDLMNNSKMITDDDVNSLLSASSSIIESNLHRNPDLLMKTKELSTQAKLSTINRVRLLRNDPSIRWSCNHCRDEANGYPGSFILHDFS